MKTVVRSKQDMVSVMSIRITEMRNELTKAGVPVTALLIPDGWEHVSAVLVRDAHKWLLDVYTGQWAYVMEIRDLLHTDLWKRYETWGGFEDSREVKMLAIAHKELRKVYNNGRPDFFKKTVVSKIIRAKTKKKKAKGNNASRSSRKASVS
jgi:hypothetical protein